MKLPDGIWNSTNIRERMLGEASFEEPNKTHYWFTVPLSDSALASTVLKNFVESPFDIAPHELQQAFAQEVLDILQNELNFDGVWMVGFTHPPSSGEAVAIDGDNTWGRLCMIWLDEDGDPQYTVDSFAPFIHMAQEGPEYYANLCATAHQGFLEHFGKKAMKEDFGIKDTQLTKQTLSTLN